ncbi:MAG: VWA domain-containing protein [Planctomycetota bacterium]
MIHDLELAHPERWPLLLLPVLLLVVVRLVAAGRRRRLARWADVAAHPVLLADAGPVRRGLALGLELAGLALVCFAALAPGWGHALVEVPQRGVDIVLCLDVSRSMEAGDLDPSRGQRARRDILALLPELRGDRVALVAFAGDARVVCPLTHDYSAFEALLAEVTTTTTRQGGTDLAAALRSALALLPDDGGAWQTIVLLTDGEDLAGKGATEARVARARGVVVHAIGYGSPEGARVPGDEQGRYIEDESGQPVLSRLDLQGLRALCESCGGVAVPAEGMALPLVRLHERRIRPMQQHDFDGVERRRLVTRYQWFLLPGLVLLLAAAGMRGRRRGPAAAGGSA